MSGPDVEERHAASLALLELKDKRIAELEAELDKCKMRTLSPEADVLVSEYTTKYKELETKSQRLRDILITYSHDGRLQTFEDRERFRQATKQALETNDD